MSIPVIIIPVLNRFDLLKTTLSSIDYPVDEVLIINNSANDSETDGFKEEFSNLNLRILNLPSNMGIAGSWNLGIKLYPHAPYWVIGSADTHLNPGALETLSPEMNEENFVMIYSFGWFSLGSDILRKVGLFDECYYPAYFEDNDYYDRMINLELSDRIKGSREKIYVDDNNGSLTIKSNSTFSSRNSFTFEKNKQHYNSKVSSGDYSLIGWNLDQRRENEWLV